MGMDNPQGMGWDIAAGMMDFFTHTGAASGLLSTLIDQAAEEIRSKIGGQAPRLQRAIDLIQKIRREAEERKLDYISQISEETDAEVDAFLESLGVDVHGLKEKAAEAEEVAKAERRAADFAKSILTDEIGAPIEEAPIDTVRRAAKILRLQDRVVIAAQAVMEFLDPVSSPEAHALETALTDLKTVVYQGFDEGSPEG